MAASVHTKRHANRHTRRLKRHTERHGGVSACHKMGETVMAEIDCACAGLDSARARWMRAGRSRGGARQLLDIDLQGGETPPTPEASATMITRKTGVLFARACRRHAYAGGTRLR
jgi:geranylgeranyl pyrophosphate synthase